MSVTEFGISRSSSESNQTLPLHQARNLFIRASAAYPASIFAQSAYMLVQLRKQEMGPEAMCQLLVAPFELDKIVIAAHKRHGKNVSVYVTSEAVVRILKVEIELMHDLQKLHDSGLQNILTVYPNLSKKPEEYSEYVQQLIVWAAQ